MSQQDFVTDAQEKKSIGTGQSSTLDDPTCIPIAHDSTMGRNNCCMCVHSNKFKSGSCKTSIKLMGEISIAMNRQEFSVVVRESKEKNHSAWVKSTDLRADNLQWRVATTVTTVIGIDAVQVEERMVTIGGPTLFARIDHRNVNVKSCKNLSMNAILKTFFNVAHLLNLDLGTTDESLVVNGRLSTFSLIFVICLILCATGSGIGLNCCSQFINACNKKCKQGRILIISSGGAFGYGKCILFHCC